ncbi:MAG: AbrB/MazE/SpoVT family DNA-binding domain-containing protein [Clostridia bacterium]|nr:AbrB/MazE/SpoVT family DNA-binding domain-containing protein [Clostridia bacterium]
MRKIDKLGRIVIPLELREKYGLTEGTSVEFLDVGKGIAVRAKEPACKLCRARISKGKSLPLCDGCILKILKEYNKGLAHLGASENDKNK